MLGRSDSTPRLFSHYLFLIYLPDSFWFDRIRTLKSAVDNRGLAFRSIDETVSNKSNGEHLTLANLQSITGND